MVYNAPNLSRKLRMILFLKLPILSAASSRLRINPNIAKKFPGYVKICVDLFRKKRYYDYNRVAAFRMAVNPKSV